MKARNKPDIIAALGLYAFCAFMYAQITKLPKSNVAMDVGAGFFPTVIVVALVFLATLLLIRGLVGGPGDRTEKTPGELKLVLVFFLIIAVGVGLINIIGFALGTFIAAVGCLLFIGWKPLWSIVYSAIVVGAIVAIFQFALQVPLPGGMLF